MKSSWWDEKSGFFGDFYFQGDNSLGGHLIKKKLSLTERTIQEVNGLVDLLDLKEPKTILDVPCGYGRHSIELSKNGHNVTGVDINDNFLKKAREKADLEEVGTLFLKKNMLSLNYKNEFDIVINMFFSFGFFESDKLNLMVLKNFYDALKNNGIFLMHTDVNTERIEKGTYKTIESRNLSCGGVLHIKEAFAPNLKRINGSWTIISNGQTTSRPYSVRVYDENEFKNMCLEVGFESCISYGSWSGEDYSDESEEIIFIAKKGV